ncbi:MAG TPA: hypothetical protein VLA24_11470 [Pseudomonadales bacterium]|nr:hypothetical protein [Pseudomonadales bacterium]
MMIALVRPILFGFLQSKAVKKLVIDLLRALASKTDNTVDDRMVDFIQANLFPEQKPVADA